MPGAPAKLAVLASGSGTILEAIIAAGVPVVLVMADRPCRALEVADRAGLANTLVDRTGFGWPGQAWDRAGFTAAITKNLQAHGVTLVAMAGFMTILAPAIFTTYAGHILNTHPSLLPAFKGAHAVADALAAGVT